MTHGPVVRARIGRVATVLVALGLATGCGGDDGTAAPSTPADTATAAPSSVATTASEAVASASPTAAVDPLDGLAFDVDGTFWHSGFVVALDSGSVAAVRDDLDEVTGHVLTLSGTFENLGDDPARFSPELAVVQGTSTYAPDRSVQAEDVPSGLVAEGQLAFEVDEDFDPDLATLVVGGADEARAEVPLGSGAGELVALEPEPVDVTGTLSVALLDMEVVGGELRWDVPRDHDQVEPGTRALTLEMTATSRKRGNWGTFADSFSLTTPDGTSVPADGAVLDSLPGNEAGLTTEGQSVRFVVDEDAAGDYTLRMLLPDFWLGEDETEAEATLDFTLGE